MIGALAAGLLAGVWRATTAGAASVAADLSITSTAVSLSAKYPCLCTG
ncbi:hypothetical protein [Streptomyces monashensis]|nr:hypothetical protein [Streptomyces monashensis]